MSRNLKNHPGLWLEDNAAVAFDRMEDEQGYINLSDAGRTVSQQQNLINRWRQGGPGNRPPSLFQPAMPAESSNHVRRGGVAFDTPEYNRVARFAAHYGFSHPYPGGDPVHFEWTGKISGGQTGGAPSGAFANGSKELKIFQEKLLRMKHDLGSSGADGILGEKTRLATMHEQKSATQNKYPGAKLTVDGIPGWATNAYLDWWLTGPGKPQPAKPAPPKGEVSVRDVQKALNKHGYELVEDNVWGDKSYIATIDFQKKNNLVPDGIVGPATRAKLGL